jgi:hypothetical protein
MKRMTTLKNQERQITGIQETLASHSETLASHGETLYELKRFRVRTDLRFGMLFWHFDIQDVSEEQVDEVLDAE